MSCGAGCCQRKNYNSDKPLSKRIPQVILVFFVVWLIGFGFIAQAFNQPTRKPKNKRRNHKKRYNQKQGFFERLVDGARHSSILVWALILLIIVLVFYLFIRVIRLQARKLESHIQDKWEEAMAEQQKRYQERMGNRSGYDYDDYDDEDYNGPRIRELETEEEEAHWRSLIEKEKRERERQIAAAAVEEEEQRKTK